MIENNRVTKHQSSRGTKLMLYKGSKGLFLAMI